MSRSQPQTLSADALAVFCSQLARMLHAGIGSEEAVGILTECAEGEADRELLTKLHAGLLDGQSLSSALEASGYFPAYLIRMVEIGQTAGRLDQVLKALAAYYRRESATAASIRRAVVYPVAMAILVALVFLVLITRVLPVFQQVFVQLGVTLSPVARSLLRAGEAGKYLGGALLLLLAVGGIYLLLRSRRGAMPGSGLLSRTETGRAVDRSRFISAMALMLSSGLPLDEAMDRTVRLLEGSALSQQLAACAGQMAEGTDFPRAASASGLLDSLQTSLLKVGFHSGVAEQTMEELAQRSQEEASERLSRLLSRMEFILVVALCGSVGLVLLSVMLPLLGVLSAIG